MTVRPLPATTLAGGLALGGLALAGAAVVSGGGRGSLVAVGCAAAVLALALAAVTPAGLRQGAVELVVWIGLIAPVAVQQDRTSAQITSSPLTPLILVQAVIPLVCLAALFLLGRPRLGSLRPIELALAAYLAVALLSAFWSVTPVVTVLKAGQLILAYVLVVMLARMSGGRDLVTSLGAFVHAVLICAFAGLILAPHDAIVPIEGGDPTSRLRGIFPVIAPDLLGFMLVIGILFLVAGVGPRWTQWRHVTAVLAIAYFVMLLLTRTRTSFALLALGLVVLWLQDRRRRSGLAFFLPVAAVVLVCGFALYSQPLGTFLGRGQDAQSLSTLTGRTTTWHDAITAWRVKPLTGYGFYAGHRWGGHSGARCPEPRQHLGGVAARRRPFGGRPTRRDDSRGRRGAGQAAVTGRPLAPLALAIFVVALLASFVNPSLQQPNYPMIVFAVVLLAAPFARVNPPARARV